MSKKLFHDQNDKEPKIKIYESKYINRNEKIINLHQFTVNWLLIKRMINFSGSFQWIKLKWRICSQQWTHKTFNFHQCRFCENASFGLSNIIVEIGIHKNTSFKISIVFKLRPCRLNTRRKNMFKKIKA